MVGTVFYLDIVKTIIYNMNAPSYEYEFTFNIFDGAYLGRGGFYAKTDLFQFTSTEA